MPVGAARDFQSHLKRGHSFSGSTKSRWPVGTACDFQSHFKRGSIVFQDRLKVDGRFSARLATFSRFSRKNPPIPEQQSNKNLQSRPSNGLMRKHPPLERAASNRLCSPQKKATERKQHSVAFTISEINQKQVLSTDNPLGSDGRSGLDRYKVHTRSSVAQVEVVVGSVGTEARFAQ